MTKTGHWRSSRAVGGYPHVGIADLRDLYAVLKAVDPAAPAAQLSGRVPDLVVDRLGKTAHQAAPQKEDSKVRAATPRPPAASGRPGPPDGPAGQRPASRRPAAAAGSGGWPAPATAKVESPLAPSSTQAPPARSRRGDGWWGRPQAAGSRPETPRRHRRRQSR